MSRSQQSQNDPRDGACLRNVVASRLGEGVVPLLSTGTATCGMAPGGEGCGETGELALEAAELARERAWGGLVLLRGVEKL